MFFNEGWLYEWFLNFTKTQEHVEQLLNSINTDTPLWPLMNASKLDNIPGYKGGDLKDALGRQI